MGSLIAELRVPPGSLGSVNMIAQTIAVGSGMLSPFISILPGQIPLMVGATVSIIAYVGMFALPTPGSYLPKVEEVQQEKSIDDMVISIQENENDII